MKRLKKEYVGRVNFGNWNSYKPNIDWSEDKTEVGVFIRTYYGPLSSTEYYITLKKLTGNGSQPSTSERSYSKPGHWSYCQLNFMSRIYTLFGSAE
jgi:hypothetical protein